MATRGDYLQATRHPWPCLLFLLPLLGVYELGVQHLGGAHPEALRNGADTWLRKTLAVAGLRQFYWAPILLLCLLLIWNVVQWKKRPGDLLGVLCGMSLESVAVALSLWAFSRGLGPLVDHLGWELSSGLHDNLALSQLVTFVGAGIYEEMLFRLMLFSALLFTVKLMGASQGLAVSLAALASALLFAAAHHLGPNGEQLEGYSFLFRTLAGLYFALVFQLRGFGVAVGGHACYDVVVGIIV